MMIRPALFHAVVEMPSAPALARSLDPVPESLVKVGRIVAKSDGTLLTAAIRTVQAARWEGIAFTAGDDLTNHDLPGKAA